MSEQTEEMTQQKIIERGWEGLKLHKEGVIVSSDFGDTKKAVFDALYAYRDQNAKLRAFVEELANYKRSEPPYLDDYHRFSCDVYEEVASEAQKLLSSLAEGKRDE